MNADIYERHRQAVETWREACQNVEFAEKQRDEARAALDNATAEIAASCANSSGKPEKKTRRGRKPKVNGVHEPGMQQRIDQELLTSSRVRLEHKPNGLEDQA